LSRHPIIDVAVVDLPFSREREPRSAIVATVDGIAIAATHLGLRGDAIDQLPVVLDALRQRALPRVLVGDLNTEHPDVASMRLVATQRTFPSDAPSRCIDHVAVEGLVVTSVSVLDEQPVGDHRPVMVTMEHEQRRQ
jgi:endonuclease/exonuclease/phosphatase family metal-dependent hydrolase